MRRTRTLGAMFGALLLILVAGGVLAQTPEPVERTPEMEQQAAELMALFPAEIGGVSLAEGLDTAVGRELLAELDPSDPDDAADTAQLNELVEAAGAAVEDMATAISLVELEDGVYAYVVAYQIRGADAQQTLPLFVAAFQQDVPEARVEQGQISDREVTLIYDDEFPEADPLVLWASGDVTWFSSAPEPFLEEAVALSTES